MRLAVEQREDVADVVEVDAGTAEVRRNDAVLRSRRRRAGCEPNPKPLIDDALEGRSSALQSSTHERRDIIIQGQCRPHASEHCHADVVMSSWTRSAPIARIYNDLPTSLKLDEPLE